MATKQISLPAKALISEHKHLVKVLKDGKDSRRHEAKEQAEELKEYKKKARGR